MNWMTSAKRRVKRKFNNEKNVSNIIKTSISNSDKNVHLYPHSLDIMKNNINKSLSTDVMMLRKPIQNRKIVVVENNSFFDPIKPRHNLSCEKDDQLKDLQLTPEKRDNFGKRLNFKIIDVEENTSTILYFNNGNRCSEYGNPIIISFEENSNANSNKMNINIENNHSADYVHDARFEISNRDRDCHHITSDSSSIPINIKILDNVNSANSTWKERLFEILNKISLDEESRCALEQPHIAPQEVLTHLYRLLDRPPPQSPDHCADLLLCDAIRLVEGANRHNREAALAPRPQTASASASNALLQEDRCPARRLSPMAGLQDYRRSDEWVLFGGCEAEELAVTATVDEGDLRCCDFL